MVAIGKTTSGRCLQNLEHTGWYNGKGGKLDTAKPKEIVRAVWQMGLLFAGAVS